MQWPYAAPPRPAMISSKCGEGISPAVRRVVAMSSVWTMEAWNLLASVVGVNVCSGFRDRRSTQEEMIT
jgi:hypothetical protein